MTDESYGFSNDDIEPMPKIEVKVERNAEVKLYLTKQSLASNQNDNTRDC